MPTIDELVAQSVSAQADKYVSQAKEDIFIQKTNAENDVNALRNQLDSQLSGFLSGVIAPAIRTDNSNVLIRDPSRLGLFDSLTGGADPASPAAKPGIAPLLIGAALIYFFFIKKRKA